MSGTGNSESEFSTHTIILKICLGLIFIGAGTGAIAYSVINYASNKRIFHRVGLQEDDWQYTYYIFENITFFQTKKRCTRMIQGYNKFIEGLLFILISYFIHAISYGWELYFDHSNNFTLYRQNYWFPNMKSIEPDWTIFYNIPENCIKS
uniref:Uncharacterized protein n=1 Tax=Heterorhabditis bacteriophora TaxID=37862 RepID=A0A1I7WT54_HETBA